MAAQPETLQVKWSKRVVHLGHPLRHSVIVRVFSLEGELKKTTGDGVAHTSNAQISLQIGESRIAVADETQSAFSINRDWTRSLIDGPDQLIIEVRRADRDLSLFETEHTKMMPR